MDKQENLDNIIKVGHMMDEINSQLIVLNATIEQDCSPICKYTPDLYIGLCSMRIKVAELLTDLQTGRKLFSDTFIKK